MADIDETSPWTEQATRSSGCSATSGSTSRSSSRWRRSACTASSASPRASACSASSGSTRASRVTSPRDPEWLDHFWVNPFGMPFGHIRVSDLILVNDQGDVVQGEAAVNRAAFAIHASVHAARPDVVAAAHSHSMYGKSWSTLGRLLDPLTQDACAFYDDHALFDDYTGVVLDLEEGKRIAHALGENKAVILRNHGLLTVGHSVDEAVWWFVTMERTCQAQLLAEAAGTPVLIDPDAGPAHRCTGRRGVRRLAELPAALRQDRPRAARPARLIGLDESGLIELTRRAPRRLRGRARPTTRARRRSRRTTSPSRAAA